MDKTKIIITNCFIIIFLCSVGIGGYYYFHQPMITLNHLLRPVNINAVDDSSPALINYQPVKLAHEKITYDVTAQSTGAGKIEQERKPKIIDFDDIENDDGYRLGFAYNFKKQTINFYYNETNEEYFNKQTTSIAEQTYKVNNRGQIKQLIKQDLNQSTDDKQQHRSKKELLKKLDIPKHSAHYLLSRGIDIDILRDKISKDLGNKKQSHSSSSKTTYIY